MPERQPSYRDEMSSLTKRIQNIHLKYPKVDPMGKRPVESATKARKPVKVEINPQLQTVGPSTVKVESTTHNPMLDECIVRKISTKDASGSNELEGLYRAQGESKEAIQNLCDRMDKNADFIQKSQAELLKSFTAALDRMVDQRSSRSSSRAALQVPRSVQIPEIVQNVNSEVELSIPEREYESDNDSDLPPVVEPVHRGKARKAETSVSGYSRQESDQEVYIYRPIRSKPLGPEAHPYLRVKVLQPINHVYGKLLNYRSYRLFLTKLPDGKRSTSDHNQSKKALRAAMREPDFNGEDPILILKFLATFVKESDAHGISEPQAFVLLPYFMEGMAYDMLLAATSGSEDPSEGGVTCWPQAINFLLATFSTDTVIQSSPDDLREVTQQYSETERQYYQRLLTHFARCGNTHAEHEKMSLFINGLDPNFRDLVGQFRSLNPTKTLLEVLQHAESYGNSHRVRRKNTYRTYDRSVKYKSQINEIQDEGPDDSTNSDESDYNNKPETVNFSYEERRARPSDKMTRPPHIAGGKPSVRRPGWVDERERSERFKHVICHHCYGKGHYRDSCPRTWSDFEIVKSNFESLTEAEKSTVPRSAYEDCMKLIKNSTGATQS